MSFLLIDHSNIKFESGKSYWKVEEKEAFCLKLPGRDVWKRTVGSAAIRMASKL